MKATHHMNMQPIITLSTQSKHLRWWSTGDELSCRLGTLTSLAVVVANLESLCLRWCGGPPTSPNLLFSFLFSDIALWSQNHKKRWIKLALHNWLMHDTNEHYFDVRQVHDRRMEYIQKTTALHIHTSDRRMEYVWKTVSRRHFNKIRRNES